MSYADPTHLNRLTRINLDDMLANFGWEHSKFGRWAASAVFHAAAQKFALQMLEFDEDVGRCGLKVGSQHYLPQFARQVRVTGQENIPAEGPLLILSNHPGMADTLVLFTSLPRLDVRVVAVDRPFLRALPATSQSILYIPEETHNRFEVLRGITDVLRAGSAVLTFPAGQIEPDPAVLPGALESLKTWSESIAIFVRRVPDLTLVGAIVSHVLSPQATFHPLTRLRRQPKDRERMGASIQLIANMLFPNLWPLTTEVAFLPPLKASEISELHDPKTITQAVRDYYARYLASVVSA